MGGAGFVAIVAGILALLALSSRREDDIPLVDEGDLPDGARERPDLELVSLDPNLNRPGRGEVVEDVDADEEDLPEDAVEVGDDEPDDELDPRIIPDPLSLAGRVTAMLWASSDEQEVLDVPLLGSYKRSTGVLGRAELYGPGTAQSLISRGNVPPTPWDWPQPEELAKTEYRAGLEFRAREEPERADLWVAAAEDVV